MTGIYYEEEGQGTTPLNEWSLVALKNLDIGSR